MLWLLVALAIWLCSGAASALLPRRGFLPTAVGAGGALVGSLVGLAFSLPILFGAPAESVRWPWAFPGGTFYLAADPLSALFLTATFTVVGLAGLFGADYFRPTAEHHWPPSLWFHFNALAASMVMVLVARNALVFLMAWEAMGLTSFFLVMIEAHDAAVRKAAWLYFVATHLGALFVLAFFAAVCARAGSFDFDAIQASGAPTGALSAGLFLVALVGFGAKAGFVPFHVWLPEAHPAAPTPVSAVMSGVMIKTGIFGMFVALQLLGPPPLWWGWTLVAVGASSGILGVLYALAQHDIKRLLAYHSVENIGIIALGMGVGLVGLAAGSPVVAALGFAGALFHVLNHAVFKALLFLGAGAAARAARSRDMEKLGGLMRRMPWTGRTFAVGSMAISGVPPLNGFVSEFLIFLGAFSGALILGPEAALALAVAAASLALIGGLAAACFIKVAGVVFLGEPRSEGARAAREAGPRAVAAMAILAALCAVLGLASPWVVPALLQAGATLSGVSPFQLSTITQDVLASLFPLSTAFAALLAIGGFLWWLRARLHRGRTVEAAPTWDCGYALPNTRMQYTASSFASPFTRYFRWAVRPSVEASAPEGPFPLATAWSSHTPDAFLDPWFTALFLGARRAAGRVLRLQNGRIQAYVLYIVAALLGLLIWQLV